ncbi:hypothetical protein TPA0907_56130 [Micromonospora humidisoli]|uniref:hypothetical protein n=1 Tax=Micromonospora sp. AKA109 TaxID=2733865 RepID=UPI0022CA8D60|nr:hypothetical protein [Micromonospora sp. AKA109]GHJ11246.1 hypothetical protein TPA0907_56130 [Micromonospora sp. AKA109]
MTDPHQHTWPGGRCPDGREVPQPVTARPAPARWPGWVIAVVVLVLTVAGIAGWWQR